MSSELGTCVNPRKEHIGKARFAVKPENYLIAALTTR